MEVPWWTLVGRELQDVDDDMIAMRTRTWTVQHVQKYQWTWTTRLCICGTSMRLRSPTRKASLDWNVLTVAQSRGMPRTSLFRLGSARLSP